MLWTVIYIYYMILLRCVFIFYNNHNYFWIRKNNGLRSIMINLNREKFYF